jgi:D-arginine dehydrogenase
MSFDVAIVGAGIAGASLAAELAGQMSVLLIEAEDQPGYHSTGRSNAFWHPTYGGPHIEPLTTASGTWLKQPPVGFPHTSFLAQRDAITIGRADQLHLIEGFERRFAKNNLVLQRVSGDDLVQRVPGLGGDWSHGILETNCFDIDVASFHAACLAVAKRKGAVIAMRARLTEAQRLNGRWALASETQNFEAAIVVNAAGAWSNNIARLCGARDIAVTPYRRTLTQVRLKKPVSPHLPFIIGIDGSFYFRPEGSDRVWLSPHDETLSPPCDAAPEETDVAIAIDRFQRVVDWPVAAVEHSWAGLRSFAPDRLPVYGFDPDCIDFFWCAGQGGFGIQTAPAAAKLCAALIARTEPDPMVAGIDVKVYAPTRFA